MRNFKKFKTLADTAFILGVSLYFVGACFQPDTASGIKMQDAFFLIAAAAVVAGVVCRTLSKFFKRRYMKELKAALQSCLKN